jgi:hypothetical protein
MNEPKYPFSSSPFKFKEFFLNKFASIVNLTLCFYIQKLRNIWKLFFRISAKIWSWDAFIFLILMEGFFNV